MFNLNQFIFLVKVKWQKNPWGKYTSEMKTVLSWKTLVLLVQLGSWQMKKFLWSFRFILSPSLNFPFEIEQEDLKAWPCAPLGCSPRRTPRPSAVSVCSPPRVQSRCSDQHWLGGAERSQESSVIPVSMSKEADQQSRRMVGKGPAGTGSCGLWRTDVFPVRNSKIPATLNG